MLSREDVACLGRGKSIWRRVQHGSLVPPAIRQQHAARMARPMATGISGDDTQVTAASVPKKTSKRGTRQRPTTAMEQRLREQGYANVVGVDEAGRGPLAGPVVVAACVVPPGVDLSGVDDSKKMSEKQREAVYELIRADDRIKWAVSIVGHQQIDRDNILQATLTGMQQALSLLAGRDPSELGASLGPGAAGSAALPDQQATSGDDALSQQLAESAPAIALHGDDDPGGILAAAADAARIGSGGTCELHYALVDGTQVPKDLWLPANAVEDGDAQCVCIAAASVLAKVTRDRLMLKYHELYPQYGFDQHKAYGVRAHMAALKEHGPCPIHRRSFEPTKSMTGWSRAQKKNTDTTTKSRKIRKKMSD